VITANDPAFGATGARLAETVESLERATHWMLGEIESRPSAVLASATPYLRLFAHAAGGCMLADAALAAARARNGASSADAHIALARFFANHIAVQALGLERTVIEGAASVVEGDAALA
jgi:hypothetical protein